MTWWHALQHWLTVHTGSSNQPGVAPNYNFWSGFGSDLSEVVLLGAVIQVIRHTNCHVRGCWRIARHPVEGTPWKVCRKHHPGIDGKPTHQDVIDAHAKEKTGA